MLASKTKGLSNTFINFASRKGGQMVLWCSEKIELGIDLTTTKSQMVHFKGKGYVKPQFMIFIVNLLLLL